MTWDEALASLNMSKLGTLAKCIAERAGLTRGYTVESLLVDTLWEAWRSFERYNSGLSAFQTWVVYLLRHTVSWHQRDDARTTLFSQIDGEGHALHFFLDPRPQPEALILRREALLEAKELTQKIEIAIEVLSRKRTKRTNLAVYRTYLRLLSESKTVQVNQAAVARAMSVPHQTVSVAMKRIADICGKCGFGV